MTGEKFLEVKNLRTYFDTPEGMVKSVDGVSFSINRGETLALVGESGCGKTVTSLSLIRLLADTARVQADYMEVDGQKILELTKDEARKLRGSKISMIFQEPMTSLNPVYRIERQLGEVFRLHEPNLTKAQVFEKSVEILKKVGVPKPEERLKVYPHQLSGGLRQRVMIAISLASNPQMLIADEPTTALDVTIQAQILELLKKLNRESGMSMLFISHNLNVVRKLCRRVAVMQRGVLVEEGDTDEVFRHPQHPYTQRLIAAIPTRKRKEDTV